MNVLNIATKSTNIGEILVYVAMFSKTIDKILCFTVPHEMKISYFFSLCNHLELGTLFMRTPIILTLLGTGPKLCHFKIWKAHLGVLLYGFGGTFGTATPGS